LCSSRVTNTLTAPKLNVVTVNQALGLVDGFAVVRTNQGLVPNEMPIDAYSIGAVRCHRISSLPAFRTWNTDIRPRLRTSEHKQKNAPLQNSN
jgi:hypothetical protein